MKDQSVNTEKPGIFRRFVQRRVKAARSMLDPSIGMDENQNAIRVSDSFKSLGGMFGTISQAFRLLLGIFSPNRDNWLSDKEQREEFLIRAVHWEIDQSNAKTVCRGLRVEQFLFLVLGLYGFSQVIFALFGWGGPLTALSSLSRLFLGILLILFSITMVSLAGWRLDMIRQHRWRPFAQWIHGG